MGAQSETREVEIRRSRHPVREDRVIEYTWDPAEGRLIKRVRGLKDGKVIPGYVQPFHGEKAKAMWEAALRDPAWLLPEVLPLPQPKTRRKGKVSKSERLELLKDTARKREAERVTGKPRKGRKRRAAAAGANGAEEIALRGTGEEAQFSVGRIPGTCRWGLFALRSGRVVGVEDITDLAKKILRNNAQIG